MGRFCDWIAVDWGTTRLRAWAIVGDAVRAEASSDQGMNSLSPEAFEPALLGLIDPWLGVEPTPVIACGMVGSRQGWVEAPYRTVPCSPLTDGAAQPNTRDGRLDVYVIPGLRQDRPADVMRGEETQIAGFLSANPGWDGVLCLPGTHTKWAHISASEVVSFRTFMTGEMFALLAEHSVLRHTVGTGGWNDVAFGSAVTETLSRPESLAGHLFGLRAASLLEGTSTAVSRARLSGLLVGAELAAARPYWLGQAVAIIGSDAMSQAYGAALALQGVTAEIADAGEMTRRGLAGARATLVRA